MYIYTIIMRDNRDRSMIIVWGQGALLVSDEQRMKPIIDRYIIDQFVRYAKDVGYITQPLIYGYVCDRIRFLTRRVE